MKQHRVIHTRELITEEIEAALDALSAQGFAVITAANNFIIMERDAAPTKQPE